DQRNTNPRGAAAEHTDHARRLLRKIDLAALQERSAVRNRHFDGKAGFEIGDHHAAAQWKRDGRRGKFLLVVNRAGRGFVTVESRPVPGGHPDYLWRRSWLRHSRRGGRNGELGRTGKRAGGEKRANRDRQSDPADGAVVSNARHLS